ncbi:MAG: RES family NAD+ phosphorylase [Acidobacteriota bacterium]|nr:RES family NAD+ phosphorylase [Acidobacteriota bacterium]
MNLRAWRIVKRKYALDAFTGEGARLYGGRWNSPGRQVVYTSESQSLAALELLVHLEMPEVLFHYVVFEVTFEPSLAEDVGPDLPERWDAEPVLRKVQAIGDEWIRSGGSAVLRVPSALIPSENNFLLNPLHWQFSKIRIGKETPFRIDRRLSKKTK